jgi:hypothetical protein
VQMPIEETRDDADSVETAITAKSTVLGIGVAVVGIALPPVGAGLAVVGVNRPGADPTAGRYAPQMQR